MNQDDFATYADLMEARRLLNEPANVLYYFVSEAEARDICAQEGIEFRPSTNGVIKLDDVSALVVQEVMR